MSTGADCRLYEKTPENWFYDLQQYPYGDCEDYHAEGPFKSYIQTYNHIRSNHANPGGFDVEPLPGCKHPTHMQERWDWQRIKVTECNQCGSEISREASANKEK